MMRFVDVKKPPSGGLDGEIEMTCFVLLLLAFLAGYFVGEVFTSEQVLRLGDDEAFIISTNDGIRSVTVDGTDVQVIDKGWLLKVRREQGVYLLPPGFRLYPNDVKTVADSRQSQGVLGS
jgi:hypothetical protein